MYIAVVGAGTGSSQLSKGAGGARRHLSYSGGIDWTMPTARKPGLSLTNEHDPLGEQRGVDRTPWNRRRRGGDPGKTRAVTTQTA